MRFLFPLFLTIVLCAVSSFAQLAPKEDPKISLMQDSTGTPLKMDFSLPLIGISDPGMLYSHFSARPLLIFYFSPKCPHCQDKFPMIQSLIKEYEPKGLTGIGIAIGGTIKKNDVRLFMDQLNASIPIFQDANSKFGPAYGTGYVPVVFLVNSDGTFYRYAEITPAGMDHLKATLDGIFQK